MPEGDASPGEFESSPAVQLLRDRAGAVRRDLAVDARTLSTMVCVCRALDGIPLAIELAAARLRTMSLDQLANRLDDRFRLLTGGSRTALPRHRTLRPVVDWSSAHGYPAMAIPTHQARAAIALRSACRGLNDDVAVPRAGVDRDLVVRRVRVFLRRNGVAHRPSLAVGVHRGSGALADADLNVS